MANLLYNSRKSKETQAINKEMTLTKIRLKYFSHFTFVDHIQCSSKSPGAQLSKNTFMFILSPMLPHSYVRPSIHTLLALQQQEQHPVWKKSAALSVMSDNKKINHLVESICALCLSLEEAPQWSKKRMSVRVCREWSGDRVHWEMILPSGSYNKSVLGHRQHSLGGLREINIITGNSMCSERANQ